MKRFLLLFVPAILCAQPGTFTNSGPTDNTAMVFAAIAGTNTCDPTVDYQTTQGGAGVNFAAVGAVGCVDVASASTNQGAVGVMGSASNASKVTNAVAGYFPSIAKGSGSSSATADRVRLWGLNPVGWDAGFNHTLLTNELDFHVTGPDTKILGMQMTGNAFADMSADSAGYLIGPLGVHKWPVGYFCTDAAATICFYIGTSNAGNGQPSMPVRFGSRTPGGVNNAGDIILSQFGGFMFTESAGSGWSFWNTPPGGVLTQQFTIQGGGGLTQNQGTIFAGLVSAFPDGSHVYCPDCVNASFPCVGGGSGAYAKKLAGGWDCR